MSLHGTIKKIEILNLETEIKNLSSEEKSIESYVRTKHETAEKYNRYIVVLYVEDPIFEGSLIIVKVFLPKKLIDNNLLEIDSLVECSSNTCHIEILGILDHFDRAYNGATQIHDERYKKDVLEV